jgi:hypothetical protein
MKERNRRRQEKENPKQRKEEGKRRNKMENIREKSVEDEVGIEEASHLIIRSLSMIILEILKRETHEQKSLFVKQMCAPI